MTEETPNDTARDDRLLDDRIRMAVQRLVVAAVNIKMETGIGEPEFTTALARALCYRLAVVMTPGTERLALNDVVEYLRDTLPEAMREVAQARADVRKVLARGLS